MKEYVRFTGLLTVSVMLYTPTGFTQDVEESASKETRAPASQEVEINEDNYRQFMELKNARQQRNMLPENAFKPNAGLQKLDKLPEESQKHLRNQLREIIVQGDEWQPGDEGKHYPYVPSEAASTNPELQKQESEAWGELVDSYHRREAQIHDNAARSQAAMAPEGASNGGSNTGNGSPGDGTGQAGASGEAGQESRPEQSSSTDSYSPGASSDPNARNTAGVSQNAMEFLKGQGLAKQGNTGQGTTGQGTTEQGTNPGPPAGNAEQQANGAGENTSSPVGDSAQGDALEQAEQQVDAGERTSMDNSTATASADNEAKSMDGSSQNALEFLQQSGNEGENAAESSNDSSLADNNNGDEQGDAEEPSQNGQQDSEEQAATSNASPALTSQDSGSEAEGESTSGVSQNALEFLVGEGNQRGQDQAMPADNSTQEGTLSIKDLMNAKGVGSGNAPPPPPDKPDDGIEPVAPPPDKDGGGQ